MEDTGIQPGQTVTPTRSKPENTPPPSPKPAIKVPEPTEPAKPAAPEAKIPEKRLFNSEESEAPQPDAPDTDGTKQAQDVTWTASEFIAHAKSFSWYAGLIAAAAALTAAVFLVTRDPVSVGVVVVGAVLLGIYAGHQPRQLEYHLSTSGLSIGQKHFSYNQFRSFSVMPEDAFASIVFMPLKRFAVPTTIYFAPEDEDKIVKMLADRLPFEERGHDAIDRLMQRIRF